MGTDLVSVCIFCVGMLFAVDFTPPPGYSAEVFAGYGTLQRQVTSGSTLVEDRADTTVKTTGVSLHWASAPAPGIGAGTPPAEVRLRFSFPNSHDEGGQSSTSPTQVTATGNGRYENFASIFRAPVADADSLELGFEQRRQKITDLLNFTSTPYEFTHERDLIAYHLDFGIGWRHRFRDLEVAGGWAASRLEARNDTPLSGILAGGTLQGARVEVRGQNDDWTYSLLAHVVGSHISVGEQYTAGPQTFFDRNAWLEAITLAATHHARWLDVLLSGTLDRSRLPGVALAVTGSEQLAFDEGYHPDSTTKQWWIDLVFRSEVARGVFPRFFFRYARGTETVGLADSSGLLPPQILNLSRGGQFPPTGSNPTAPEYTIGIGLEAVFGNRLNRPLRGQFKLSSTESRDSQYRGKSQLGSRRVSWPRAAGAAQMSAGVMPDGKRNRQADTEPMPYELGDLVDDRRVAVGDGGQGNHDEVHEEIDESSEDHSARDRVADEDGELAAREVVDGGRTERDAEVKDEAENDAAGAEVERLAAEHPGRDRLGDAKGILRTVDEHRVGHVEQPGDQAADEDGGERSSRRSRRDAGFGGGGSGRHGELSSQFGSTISRRSVVKPLENSSRTIIRSAPFVART